MTDQSKSKYSQVLRDRQDTLRRAAERTRENSLNLALTEMEGFELGEERKQYLAEADGLDAAIKVAEAQEKAASELVRNEQAAIMTRLKSEIAAARDHERAALKKRYAESLELYNTAMKNLMDAQRLEKRLGLEKFVVACGEELAKKELTPSHRAMLEESVKNVQEQIEQLKQPCLLPSDIYSFEDCSWSQIVDLGPQEPKYSIGLVENEDGGWIKEARLINKATGQEIPPDEPVFILRAKDKYALEALYAYTLALEQAYTDQPGESDHYNAVLERQSDFQKFQNTHPDRMTVPTTPWSLPPSKESNEQ